MNDPRDKAAEGTSLLEEAVLEVLYEAGKEGFGLGAAEISQRTQIYRERGVQNMLNDAIVTGLLNSLHDQGRVERHRQRSNRGGWRLTAGERAKRDLPAQRLAPMRFSVLKERLSLLPEPFPADDEKAFLNDARADLLEQSGGISSELTGSNYDPKLLMTVDQIRARLAARENVISLGLSNERLTQITTAMVDELSSGLYGSLHGLSQGIRIYLSHFLDWQSFLENAVDSDLDVDSAKDITDLGDDISSHLAGKSELADPEIPRCFRYFAEFATNPGRAAKRLAFGIWRSAENMVIALSVWTKDIATDAGQILRKRVARAAAEGAFLSLISIIAPKLVVLAAAIPGSSWLIHAVERLLRRLTEHDG